MAEPFTFGAPANDFMIDNKLDIFQLGNKPTS